MGRYVPHRPAPCRGGAAGPRRAIRQAQETLWRALRVVAEPGGATALAPLLAGLYRPKPGERIGVLLCGANTTAVDFTR